LTIYKNLQIDSAQPSPCTAGWSKKINYWSDNMDRVFPKFEGSAKHLQKKLTLMCGLVLAATGSQYAAAQEEGESALAIEEVIVTSRKR